MSSLLSTTQNTKIPSVPFSRAQKIEMGNAGFSDVQDAERLEGNELSEQKAIFLRELSLSQAREDLPVIDVFVAKNEQPKVAVLLPANIPQQNVPPTRGNGAKQLQIVLSSQLFAPELVLTSSEIVAVTADAIKNSYDKYAIGYANDLGQTTTLGAVVGGALSTGGSILEKAVNKNDKKPLNRREILLGAAGAVVGGVAGNVHIRNSKEEIEAFYAQPIVEVNAEDLKSAQQKINAYDRQQVVRGF